MKNENQFQIHLPVSSLSLLPIIFVYIFTPDRAIIGFCYIFNQAQ